MLALLVQRLTLLLPLLSHLPLAFAKEVTVSAGDDCIIAIACLCIAAAAVVAMVTCDRSRSSTRRSWPVAAHALLDDAERAQQWTDLRVPTLGPAEQAVSTAQGSSVAYSSMPTDAGAPSVPPTHSWGVDPSTLPSTTQFYSHVAWPCGARPFVSHYWAFQS